MGYWENKCFMCLWYSTLAAIVALSAKPIYNDIKQAKHKRKIERQYSDTTNLKQQNKW